MAVDTEGLVGEEKRYFVGDEGGICKKIFVFESTKLWIGYTT